MQHQVVTGTRRGGTLDAAACAVSAVRVPSVAPNCPHDTQARPERCRSLWSKTTPQCAKPSPDRGGLWLWEHALEIRPELRGRFVLISSEARPGEQGMGLFLQSEHFLVRPFSLEGLLDQAEEIGRGT